MSQLVQNKSIIFPRCTSTLGYLTLMHSKWPPQSIFESIGLVMAKLIRKASIPSL